MLRNSNASREEILDFQNDRLQRLIVSSYKNVPYYRELFDRHGIDPRDIRSVADLPKIPVTSKKDLQALPVSQITSSEINAENLIARTTSGSTGEPFTIRRSWFEERLLGLFRLRAMHYMGQRISDRVASVGLVRTTHPRDKQLPIEILQNMGFYRRVRIDSLLPAADILRMLQEYCPDLVTGFPGVLSLVAQNMIDRESRSIRPRFVRVNGEVLTPLMRQQIAEAFGAPVLDFYASHEFRVIAYECHQTRDLHTCDDSVIVEVLKDGRAAMPGERGELVGTALHSYAMPFIRFKLGDVVTKGSDSCECGQPFSTIRAIQGRMVDYFPLPDGTQIHPFEIVLVIYQQALSWVRQYQLVQEREDRILLRVVPFATPKEEQIRRLKESARLLIGNGVEFEVMLVPEIPIEPNGKFRVSRSMVKSAYDGVNWVEPGTLKTRVQS